MKKEFTITVYTENQVGLLNRIAIIFSRRKINIDSLNVSPSEVESIHRFTIVMNETEDVVRKLCFQIEKQVEVLKAYFNTNDEIIWQEMALYKVPIGREDRAEDGPEPVCLARLPSGPSFLVAFFLLRRPCDYATINIRARQVLPTLPRP